MILDRVPSITKKSIRLTDERWMHITENHTEIAGLRQEILETVYQPDFVVRGTTEEFYAVRWYKALGNHVVVVYREKEVDGFIITAFRVRNVKPFLRKDIVWKKQ